MSHTPALSHQVKHDTTCDQSAVGSETASVRVTFEDGTALHLCQHHANRHGAALVAAGAIVASLSDIDITKREKVYA